MTGGEDEEGERAGRSPFVEEVGVSVVELEKDGDNEDGDVDVVFGKWEDGTG